MDDNSNLAWLKEGIFIAYTTKFKIKDKQQPETQQRFEIIDIDGSDELAVRKVDEIEMTIKHISSYKNILWLDLSDVNEGDILERSEGGKVRHYYFEKLGEIGSPYGQINAWFVLYKDQETCTMCNGSGLCSCNEKLLCEVCQGTGSCYFCNGTGKVKTEINAWFESVSGVKLGEILKTDTPVSKISTLTDTNIPPLVHSQKLKKILDELKVLEDKWIAKEVTQENYDWMKQHLTNNYEMITRGG